MAPSTDWYSVPPSFSCITIMELLGWHTQTTLPPFTMLLLAQRCIKHHLLPRWKTQDAEIREPMLCCLLKVRISCCSSLMLTASVSACRLFSLSSGCSNEYIFCLIQGQVILIILTCHSLYSSTLLPSTLTTSNQQLFDACI